MIDCGLWAIAEKLFEEDILEDDSEETIGAKSMLAEPSFLACFSAMEIHNKIMGRAEDYNHIKRLSRILRETSELMRGGTHPGNYFSTLSALTEALVQYPNDLVPIKIDGHTLMGDLIRLVSDKTSWVSSELEHLEKLSILRLKDLEHFCVALSREIRLYDPSKGVRYLAA